MARFNPSPDPTNDPNYLGYSKEPDKVRGDSSLGTLFSGVGDIVGAAAKAADTEIQEKIRREATSQIDALNREHGGYLSPDEIPAIAGKGTRGARYAQATESGLPVEDLKEDPVPAGVARSLDGLKKMARAYNAGELSNSMYEARFTAIVSGLRANYPAYREQIDAITASIRGAPAANNLRKSILQDMQSLAAAGAASDKANEAWYKAEQEYLHLLHPDKPKEWMIANRAKLEIDIGQIKAKELDLKIRDQQLTHEGKVDAKNVRDMGRVLQEAAAHEISTFMRGQSNLHGTTLDQLRSRVIDVQTRARAGQASPEEVAQVRQAFLAIKATLGEKVEARWAGMNSSRFVDSPTRKQIKDQVLSQLDGIEQMINSKDGGLAGAMADMITYQNDNATIRATKNFPILQDLAVIRRLAGETAASIVTQHDTVLPKITNAILSRQLTRVIDTNDKNPPPSVTEILDPHKREDGIGEVPSPVIRNTTDRIHKLAQDKNPEVAFRAVQSMYDDPKWFAQVPPSQKRAIFTRFGNPAFTAKMQELGKTKPEAWTMYSNWMEENFKGVFKQAADDFQRGVQFDQYDTEFMPKQFQFLIKTKPEILRVQRMRGQVLPGQDPAQGYADGINQGLAMLKPVLEAKYGEAAQARLVDILGQMGVDPSTAGTRGTFLDELGKKVWETLEGMTFDERHPTPKREGGEKPAGSMKQRIAEGVDLRFIDAIANSVRVNPEKWDEFIQKARKSTNIEDRRGEEFDPALLTDFIKQLVEQ